ncbi:MAG: carbohydrate porin [Bacteroidales bacterium]|jgi:high affinity Mn2+ porin
MIKRLLLITICFYPLVTSAQSVEDSLMASQKLNFHFQNTLIYQYHPSFDAKYSGKNSLINSEEKNLSASVTFFLGLKLWRWSSVYFNSEMTAGSGFSQTHGIAGFPNGEVYRVDNTAPRIYIARLLFNQVIPLTDKMTIRGDDNNQLAGKMPLSYISLTFGKFSIMDYFDQNSYSHEPRTQFYNWALMGNGAWDYPANTRGYTYGLVAELVKPLWAVRFAEVMVAEFVNGDVMDWDLRKARSQALEFQYKYNLFNKKGEIRLFAYYTLARMGSYRDAIDWGMIHNTAPDIDSVNRRGNTKYGFGINIEQNLGRNTGFFLRAGWNDGHNESWAFTEIDMTFSAGIELKGSLWNMEEDRLGLAMISNLISKDHREYLQKGGYGFMIGDGNLNYGSELIAEIYYSFKFGKYPVWLSPDYQFILNPGYNKDRGPVNAFGIRVRTAL